MVINVFNLDKEHAHLALLPILNAGKRKDNTEIDSNFSFKLIDHSIGVITNGLWGCFDMNFQYLAAEAET